MSVLVPYDKAYYIYYLTCRQVIAIRPTRTQVPLTFTQECNGCESHEVRANKYSAMSRIMSPGKAESAARAPNRLW